MRLRRRTSAGALAAGVAAAVAAGGLAQLGGLGGLSGLRDAEPGTAVAAPPSTPGPMLGSAPVPSPRPSPVSPVSPVPTPVSVPAGASAPVLAPIATTAATGAAPSAAGLAAALAPVLRTPALRAGTGLVVLDGEDGRVLYERESRVPRVPASTAKLLTGAAALDVLGPRTRLATRVVRGRGAQLVLVGGGDPTLTSTRPGPAPDPALEHRAATSLPDLADAAAATLRGQPVPADGWRVAVDDTLFAAPAQSPDWRPAYVDQGAVGPVSALAVDSGRVRPGGRTRVADPALDAGRRFAALLRAQGLRVAPDPVRGRAEVGGGDGDGEKAGAGEAQNGYDAQNGQDGRELAVAYSPPVHTLVEEALSRSDNDVAEALARLVAIRQGRPATFRSAAEAVTSAVAGLGVPVEGVRLLDGSGLSRGSRVPPVTLARLVRAGLDEARPELRALSTGLPVGAFNGTLDDRFAAPAAAAGRGAVRAKTGTLLDSHALAGSVRDRQGRLLVFVVIADRVAAPAADAARAELDRLAAALAACGCR